MPAFFLAVLAALQSGEGVWLMLGLTAGVFAVVQIIQDAILTPRIVGRTMSLSPAFFAAFAVSVGQVVGLLGPVVGHTLHLPGLGLVPAFRV